MNLLFKSLYKAYSRARECVYKMILLVKEEKEETQENTKPDRILT